MKRLALFFSLSLLFISFTGCKNNEPNDYETAMASADITMLETYLETYPKAPLEHISSIKKRLDDLYEDEFAFDQITLADDILERFEEATNYATSYPNGLHIDEAKTIIARDSAEVYRIIAEAEYNRKYGTIRDRVKNAYFIRDDWAMMISCPDKNGEGYGKISNIGSWSDLYSPVWFSYTVKEGNKNVIICAPIPSGSLFRIELFDDSVYCEGNGVTRRFQNSPAPDDWESQIESIIKQCKEQEKK